MIEYFKQSYFVKYLDNIYNFFKYLTIKKTQENTIHENIYLFLYDLSNQWKHNKIQNLDLICDILNIYHKNKCSFNYIEKKETYFKYYILGWYMYQHIGESVKNTED